MIPSDLKRASWQWQPTLTTHDPSPPITLEDVVITANTYNDDISISRLESILDSLGYGAGGSLTILGRESVFASNIATLGTRVNISEIVSVIETATGNLIVSIPLSERSGISDTATVSIGKQVSINQITGFNNSTTLGMFSVINLSGKFTILHGVNLSAQSGLSIGERLFIVTESSITTNQILLIVQTLSNVLGMSASAQANMQASLPISEQIGILEGASQVLNSGLGLGSVYSILTLSDTTVIIVTGFGYVFTQDLAKFLSSPSDTSSSVGTSDE